MEKEIRLKLPLWVLAMGLILALSVLGVSIVKTRQVQAQVMEETEKMVEATPAAEMMEEESELVDYYLPYPGMLPDHPFYWLKMARDRIQLWLTAKPLLRAERLLLYADKRLGAGWALVDGNKRDLGVTTLTKAEKYLERSVVAANDLDDSGEAIKFKEKLEKAVGKHSQVLSLVSKKLEGDQKQVVEQMTGETKEDEMESDEAIEETQEDKEKIIEEIIDN